MSNLRVGAIDSVNGNNALSIAADGSMTHGGYAMSTGMVKLADAEWSTDTDGVNFDVINTSKYIHYKMYWWVCGDSVAGNSNTTAWYQTGMCFRDANGNLDGSGAYDNNTRWANSGDAAYTINSSQAGAQNRIWLAGNGQGYDSHGEVLISVPPNSNFRACVRGISQLVGSPRTGGAATNYCEEFSSVLFAGSNTDPTLLTGFRFCSYRGTTGNYSKRGYVSVYGIER